MGKIEELLKQFDNRTPPLTQEEWSDYSKTDMIEFAKIYAEWYAKSILEVCLNETTRKEEYNTPDDWVSTELIWKLYHNLPPHE